MMYQNLGKRITKQSDYNELIDMLRSFGYQKTSKVEEFGQYRISGSIIDFFFNHI